MKSPGYKRSTRRRRTTRPWRVKKHNGACKFGEKPMRASGAREIKAQSQRMWKSKLYIRQAGSSVWAGCWLHSTHPGLAGCPQGRTRRWEGSERNSSTRLTRLGEKQLVVCLVHDFARQGRDDRLEARHGTVIRPCGQLRNCHVLVTRLEMQPVSVV